MGRDLIGDSGDDQPHCGRRGTRDEAAVAWRDRPGYGKANMVAWRCAQNPARHDAKDGTEMPAGFVQTYRAFAYNNAWANHRLLTACASLSQQEFEAKRTGFFPSLQMTLNHIYVIDLFYVDALEGGWLGPKAWENEAPCPSLAELKPAQADVDKRLIKVCNALSPALLGDIVQVNRDTRVQTERRDRLLMHLFQHQIHHRGQAHAMLSATTLEPPQLDEFFSIAEAPLRASEFDDLGWTEETVWGPR
jgi:uncharacterized damage-inducible protein DinB